MTSSFDLLLKGLGFATGPLLARGLGPDGRGDIAAVLAPFVLLSYISAFGFPFASLVLRNKVNRRALLGTASAMSLALTTPVVMVSWWLLPIFLGPERAPLIEVGRWLLLSLFVTAPLAVIMNLILSDRPGVIWNVLRSLPPVANAALLVGLTIADELTVVTALGAQLVSGLMHLLPCLVIARSWGRPSWSRPTARRLLLTGSTLTVASSGDIIVLTLDQAVLAATVSSRELGFYAVAVSYALLNNIVNIGYWAVGLNRFRELVVYDAAMSRRFVRISLRNQALGAFALALGSYPGILLLFGREFLPVLPLVLVLLLAGIVSSYASALTVVCVARGRSADAARGSALAAGVTITGLSVLAWLGMSALGAAVVTVLAHTCRAAYFRQRSPSVT
jgi:O-antigen/teichoic acid export membrane protein